MNIILMEPYFSGSHKRWANQLVELSNHQIQLFSLPGRFWKWRMEGSAIAFAKMINELDSNPHLFLCSSMMDVSLFKNLLCESFKNIPIIYYLHENQLTYPISKLEKNKEADMHYGFINYKSCLVADYCIFNSKYHKDSFLGAALQLLNRLPDHSHPENVELVESKSSILPIGIDFDQINAVSQTHELSANPNMTLLWNHRWEHDKRPDLFIDLCDKLDNVGLDFNINFIGQHHDDYPSYIDDFKLRHLARIQHFGFVEPYSKYISVLKSSDLLPVTSEHDFFGISVLEACYCNVHPLLPKSKVYEEHFPDDHETIFFDGFEMLEAKCIEYYNCYNAGQISNISLDNIEKYSLDNVIRQYDQSFEEIKKEFNSRRTL